MKLEVNGKQVEYYQFGKGPNTLVMIPGLGVTSCIPMGAFVEKQYSQFIQDYTVYLIERADVLNQNETVDTIAQDYIEVFKQLHLTNIYLFGTSFGGMIGQSIVYQVPYMINKLVLASTSSGYNKDSFKGIEVWKKLAQEGKIEELANILLYDIYSKEIAKSLIKENIELWNTLSKKDFERFMIQCEAIINFNSSSYLNEIHCPTFIIGAKGDQLFPYEDSIYLHEKILDSELYLYDEKWPHCVFDEAKDFTDKLYQFFHLRKEIKAVIFDCDGVLFDSEPYFELGTKELIRTYGIEMAQEIFDRNIGGTGRMMIEDIKRTYPSIPDSVDELEKKFFIYTDKYLMSDSVKPFEGLVEFIKGLHEKGYTLALASSSPRYYVDHKLKLFEINSYFDLVVSSNDVTKCKPDPQVYLITVNKLGIPRDNCIVIEDATNGIKSAKNAGLYCIAYKGSVVKQDTSLANEEVYDYKDIEVLK